MSVESVPFGFEIGTPEQVGVERLEGADFVIRPAGQFPNDILGSRGHNAVSLQMVISPYDTLRNQPNPIIGMKYMHNGLGSQLDAIYVNTSGKGQRAITPYNQYVLDELVHPAVTETVVDKDYGFFEVDLPTDRFGKWNQIFATWQSYEQVFKKLVDNA